LFSIKAFTVLRMISFGIAFGGLSMNFRLYIACKVPTSTVKFFLSLLLRFVTYVFFCCKISLLLNDTSFLQRCYLHWHVIIVNMDNWYSMWAPLLAWNTSRRYSSSCHVLWSMSAGIAEIAFLIRDFRSSSHLLAARKTSRVSL
jgi:hypothetical protein